MDVARALFLKAPCKAPAKVLRARDLFYRKYTCQGTRQGATQIGCLARRDSAYCPKQLCVAYVQHALSCRFHSRGAMLNLVLWLSMQEWKSNCFRKAA